MVISFEELKSDLKKILIRKGFSESKADRCAAIFAGNTRDGVHSHGVNRFPVFIDYINQGLINITAEPTIEHCRGSIENWNGNLAPGMYTATLAMDRSITIAKQNGLGLVAVKNTNHWMRGGTYGWQAADKGCIAICGTNTIANMPPWGGSEPRLGNNPLVIAVPRSEGHIVLDMAMSQYSYGKLNEYKMKGEELPFEGGYDENGNLTKDPSAIIATQRTLPVGYWKGSGLSLLIDVLVSTLSGGRSVKDITGQGTETGVSQFFLCISPNSIDESIIHNIVAYAKSSVPVSDGSSVKYPGEQSLASRLKSEAKGINISDEIWSRIQSL